MALERHGALSGRHHEHGTTHWHSTPGVEMGHSFWGGLFPLHARFLCSFFFLFRVVDVGMWGWHLGTGESARCVLWLHARWLLGGIVVRARGTSGLLDLRLHKSFCWRIQTYIAIVKFDHGNPKFISSLQSDMISKCLFWTWVWMDNVQSSH
jgi:hypothetical protein